MGLKKSSSNLPLDLRIKSELSHGLKYFFAGYFQMFFKDAITSSKFPSSLKMVNIKAVFKKGTKSLKEKHRAISILPLTSKIFERIICK